MQERQQSLCRHNGRSTGVAPTGKNPKRIGCSCLHAFRAAAPQLLHQGGRAASSYDRCRAVRAGICQAGQSISSSPSHVYVVAAAQHTHQRIDPFSRHNGGCTSGIVGGKSPKRVGCSLLLPRRASDALSR